MAEETKFIATEEIKQLQALKNELTSDFANSITELANLQAQFQAKSEKYNLHSQDFELMRNTINTEYESTLSRLDAENKERVQNLEKESNAQETLCDQNHQNKIDAISQKADSDISLATEEQDSEIKSQEEQFKLRKDIIQTVEEYNKTDEKYQETLNVQTKSLELLNAENKKDLHNLVEQLNQKHAENQADLDSSHKSKMDSILMEEQEKLDTLDLHGKQMSQEKEALSQKNESLFQQNENNARELETVATGKTINGEAVSITMVDDSSKNQLPERIFLGFEEKTVEMKNHLGEVVKTLTMKVPYYLEHGLQPIFLIYPQGEIDVDQGEVYYAFYALLQNMMYHVFSVTFRQSFQFQIFDDLSVANVLGLMQNLIDDESTFKKLKKNRLLDITEGGTYGNMEKQVLNKRKEDLGSTTYENYVKKLQQKEVDQPMPQIILSIRVGNDKLNQCIPLGSINTELQNMITRGVLPLIFLSELDFNKIEQSHINSILKGKKDQSGKIFMVEEIDPHNLKIKEMELSAYYARQEGN